MYEYQKKFQQKNFQIYIHHRLYSEMGRLPDKDSGRQDVFYELTYWCRVGFTQVLWRLVSHSSHLTTALFKFRLQTGHESVFSKVLAISVDTEFTSQYFKVS